MVKLPSPSDEDTGSTDELAKEESEAYTEKIYVPELAESKKKLLKEIDDLRKAAFWGARCIVKVAVLLIIAAIAVWAWHMLTPDKWRWLTKDEVTQIQGIIFSGAISALVTLIGKRVF